MRLIGELDWPRILYRRSAAISLGVAAVLSVVAVFMIHLDFSRSRVSPANEEVVSILGAVGALGFIALLICMGFFWLKCDVTSRSNRTIWFVILLLGSAYGAHVAYFAIVYLPEVIGELRSPGSRDLYTQSIQIEDGPNRLGPFRRSFLVVWALWLPTIFAVMVLQKPPEALAAIIGVSFFLWSMVVIIEAPIHFVLSIYRAGMSRGSAERPAQTRRRGP